jgi:hypothetical protein
MIRVLRSFLLIQSNHFIKPFRFLRKPGVELITACKTVLGNPLTKTTSILGRFLVKQCPEQPVTERQLAVLLAPDDYCRDPF